MESHNINLVELETLLFYNIGQELLNVPIVNLFVSVMQIFISLNCFKKRRKIYLFWLWL